MNPQLEEGFPWRITYNKVMRPATYYEIHTKIVQKVRQLEDLIENQLFRFQKPKYGQIDKPNNKVTYRAAMQAVKQALSAVQHKNLQHCKT